MRRGEGKPFLAEESGCKHVQRGVWSAGERRGGSDEPSPGWLLKWDGSSAAPEGGSPSEHNWSPTGRSWDRRRASPCSRGLTKAPWMTPAQERNTDVASQDHGGRCASIHSSPRSKHKARH